MKTPDIEQIFATDKEIFDLIMSATKRLSKGVLLELLADRRIFCSANSSREDIANLLSSLPHDFHDLAGLISKGEYNRRADRTTSIELATELPSAQIREAITGYQHEMRATERVSMPFSTSGRVRMNVEYDEIDYSRTRLIQRQRKEADIDFTIKDGKTVIRLPATAKARRIAADLKKRIEASRKDTIFQREISVGHMVKAKDRTDFFMKLASGISGFKFDMAYDAKVARFADDAEVDHDSDDRRETKQEALSVINSISIRGVNIIVTPEYQKLIEQGFFLTSLTWRSSQIAAPRDQIQFEAAFEDGIEGTNFRYMVRHRERRGDGELMATFRPLPDNRKPALFQLIEQAAHAAIDAIHPLPSPPIEKDRGEVA